MLKNYTQLVSTGTVYVLRANGTVRGAVVLSRATDGDSLLVNDLVVDPPMQGQGYGRLLMGFAEEEARARGLVALTLFTNEKMEENRALYAKIGFTETERMTEDGFDRVFFRKDLGRS